MNWLISPLVLVTFFPLIGFCILFFIPKNQISAIRWTALSTSIINFGFAIWLLSIFDKTTTQPQLAVNTPWVNLAGSTVHFFLAIDGLGLMMVLLTTFLAPLIILSTWNVIIERVKEFMLSFLLLETSLLGVFLAFDLVVFFIFWEFVLLPMYFLIGIFGGERRLYATLKFFLFTMAGSIMLMLAILYLGWQGGSYALPDLINSRSAFAGAETWLFLAFALAFAVKAPIWPLHTWLPDTYTEAPTAGSAILAGVLAKMGTYGLLRFNLSLFPEATIQFAPWMAGLAVIGIIYGAAVAFMQRDIKRLLAFSSISHLGFIVLGIFALNQQGISGSILQMVNHGLTTGALFLIFGMLIERRHSREMASYGGLWKLMPSIGSLTLIFTLSSMALPGLNSFVGEFNILLGAFGSQTLASTWFGIIATVGVILTAIYLLFMFEKIFLGPIGDMENNPMPDINLRELAILIPILVLILWIGIYPKPFFEIINPTVEGMLAYLQSTSMAYH